MFNLEQAIADWRQKMLAGGIDPSEELEELEGHLREDIGRRMRAGESPESAFTTAAQQLGAAGSLTTEFSKINPYLSMKSIITILSRITFLFGIAIILVGMAFVLPALAKLTRDLAVPNEFIANLMLGTIVTTVGACVLLNAIVARLKRSKC